MADLELEGKVSFDKSIKEESKKLKEAFKDIIIRVTADTSEAKKEIEGIGKGLKTVKIRAETDPGDFAKTLRSLKDSFDEAGIKSGRGFGEKFMSNMGVISKAGSALLSNLAKPVADYTSALSNDFFAEIERGSIAVIGLNDGLGNTKSKLESFGGVIPVFRELTERLNELFVPDDGLKKQLSAQADGYKLDAVRLKKQLLEKKISLEEYSKQSEEIESGRVSATEKLNEQMSVSFDKLAEAVGLSFDAINNYLSNDFVNSLKKAQETFARFTFDSSGNVENIEYDFVALKQTAVTALGSIGAAMGEALAAGENVGNAFLVQLLDLAQKAVLTYIPLIYAQFIEWLGPIAGPIGATAAIALIQGGLAVAKGAIGAEEGVVGIGRNYNRKRGATDTIPVWLAPGETVISAEKTMQNRDLLEALNSNRIEEFLHDKIQPIHYYGHSDYAVNEFGELIKTNRALLNAINGGIDVNAKNFHKIQIVDKTSGGVKVQNWR